MRFILFLVLISASVWAKPGRLEIPTKDGVILVGQRLANPGKPRVLLVHGISETFRVFRFAQGLQQQGFDVYMVNSRGHGNGSERSLNPEIDPFRNQDGYYGFDNMVGYDMPAMIDAVSDGRPIIIIGHSLGGAEARFFLSGARLGKRGIYQTKNDMEIQKYLDKVSLLITLGSPVTFDISHFAFQMWHNIFPQLSTNLIMGTVARDADVDGVGVIRSFKHSVSNIFYDKIHRLLVRVGTFEGLINTKNLDSNPNELGQLFLTGFSKFSVDYVNDVQRWAQDGFRARSGFPYEGMKLPDGLSLDQIVGGEDELVTPASIFNEHDEHEFSGNPKVTELEDFSHIDLAASTQVLPVILDIISEFQCSMLFAK